MTGRRLFLPPERIDAGRARLTPEARHYVKDVLRLAPGAALELFDGQGGRWDARVDEAFEALALGPRQESAGAAPGAAIWIVPALAKGEKMDLVVQKATELGAARVAAFEAERSVVRLEPDRAEERARRWRRIAEEAARQCGRADVPEVATPASLAARLAETPPGFGTVVFHGAGAASLASLAPAPGGWIAIVGPEGGLTTAEVAACEAAGASRVSLGPRVLRAETAAIAAVALLQARFGDMG
jgi:16S rRNA (uracil1498-N3)-methyltransferase